MNPVKNKYTLLSCVLLCTLCLLFSGCAMHNKERVKLQDLDFTVLSEENIPEEIKEMIAKKQTEPFSFAFKSSSDLFLCVGYGEQKSGGFSIAINELYQTEENIVVNTTLLGPSAKEAKVAAPSYPFLVIRTQAPDLEVIFE